MNPDFLHGQAAQCLGWALLHFLWQGAAIALLLKLVLNTLRGRNALARYSAGCCALILMAVAPPATFYILHDSGQETGNERAPVVLSSNADDSEMVVRTVSSRVAGHSPDGLPSKTSSLRERFEERLPLVLVLWSTGVVLLSTRLLFGCWQVRRLKSR